MCGGTSGPAACRRAQGGLSPRVRGNRDVMLESRHRIRSIPACAGEPAGLCPTMSTTLVYPRVCGEPCTIAGRPLPPLGLSPRVRGNQSQRDHGAGRRGSIPACAGEPRASCRSRRKRPVYPRVCGGTARLLRAHRPRAGLSPRVRGTAFIFGIGLAPAGLSPRVRGNHLYPSILHGGQGSIPACAGEPIPGGYHYGARQVYPRVCGGTPRTMPNSEPIQGLSPRVRGNHDETAGAGRGDRSIPACAGNRLGPGGRACRKKVYPRVCGGTSEGKRHIDIPSGLSPRVRGNHARPVEDAAVWGSIPACAGEPSWAARPGRGHQVYPRVCGGTGHGMHTAQVGRGLSPRVAGEPTIRLYALCK